MTNKINTMLKAIIDQITGTLPSDTVKNPKLGTHPVLSARSYPTMDLQCSTQIHNSINAITIHPKHPEESQVNEPNVRKLNSMLESLGLVPQSSNTKFVCSIKDDEEVMFIQIIRDDDEPQNKGPNEGEETTTEESIVEYFDTFLTRDELTYHKGPFVEISNMTHDPPEGVVRFIKGADEVAYKMPHKIEQYDSLSNLEKEHTKSVYLRNKEDKRRGVKKAHLLEDKQKHISVEGYLMRYFSFGRHLEELHVTWAHLEKKRTRLRTYTNIDQEFLYSGWRRRHKYNVTPSPRRSRRCYKIPATALEHNYPANNLDILFS
ncbi:hypothetical protein Tco_0414291 [Tanacetum coccineum]